MTPFAIFYKPHVNSRTLQRERPGDGSQEVEGYVQYSEMRSRGSHGGGQADGSGKGGGA